jgi:hypothetical protein
MNTRIVTLLMSSIATLLCAPANAQTTDPQIVNLIPVDDGTVVDQFPFDGIANSLEGDFVVVELTDFEPTSETLGERRGVVEFDISGFVGRHVQRATLRLTNSFMHRPDGTFVIPIEVRRYRGNGLVGLNDFHRGTFATTFDMRSLQLGIPTGLNVTHAVRRAVAEQWTYLGFVLRTNIPSGVSFRSLEFTPAPVLVLRLE